MIVDKKAVMQTVALLLLSWAAFPFIYYMLVKRNKHGVNNMRNKKEVKTKNENMG